MENIITILEGIGIKVDDAQKETLTKKVAENYKTIAEVEKKDAKIQALTDKVSTTESALKKFEGIDADALKGEIETLKKSLADKDAEFTKKLADRDFDDLIRTSIADAKGLNAKAITSLLDIDTLKKSQNQKEDIANALKTLATAEDSKMLFATSDNGGGRRASIGGIRNNNNNNDTYLDERYKNNPYYHPNN